MKAKVRVCGARCHNAKGTKCTCWCGGAYHGMFNSSNPNFDKELFEKNEGSNIKIFENARF